MVFEDKMLYSSRTWRDDRWVLAFLGSASGWAHVRPGAHPVPDVLVIAPGGVALRALDAATTLLDRDGVVVHVLVPARLFPLDLEPLSPLLAAGLVVVADEGTEGGSWATEVAQLATQRAWSRLRAPVRVVNSQPGVVPAARHLERSVLVSADAIAAAIGELVAGPPGAGNKRVPITLPRLNANADTYVLTAWLCAEHEEVHAGQPVASMETSKAVQDVLAPRSGRLRRLVEAGADCPVGAELGYLTDVSDEDAAPNPVPLGRVQRAVAAVVTRARAEIPTAFTVVEMTVTNALARLAELTERTGATVGLPDLLVKIVAERYSAFPVLFGTLVGADRVEIPERADVAVTLDCGNGLFVPVVRDAARRSLSDIADELMDFRLKAAGDTFTVDDLVGANITLSLNMDCGVVLAQPIVTPGQLCAVSVGAVRGAGVVNVGLAYDHRVVNGADAMRFLGAVKEMIENP